MATLKSAADHHDLILTAGAASRWAKKTISSPPSSSRALDLWQIAMKPGKPFAHGTVRRDAGAGTDAAGSVFHRSAGQPGIQLHHLPAAGSAVSAALAGRARNSFEDHRASGPFLAARPTNAANSCALRRNAAGGLDLFSNQSSGVLTSVVWGDGVVDNPAGMTIAHGDLVSFIPFSELLA